MIINKILLYLKANYPRRHTCPIFLCTYFPEVFNIKVDMSPLVPFKVFNKKTTKHSV